MRRMLCLYSIVGVIVLSSGEPAVAACSSLTRELDSIVVEHLAELRGTQYCTHSYRSQQVEIVLYFVEGSCFTRQAPAGSCGKRTLAFVAGYAGGRRLEPLQVGASGDFIPKKISVENNILLISGAAYAADDPVCCPTLEAQRRARITPDGFILSSP